MDMKGGSGDVYGVAAYLVDEEGEREVGGKRRREVGERRREVGEKRERGKGKEGER